MEGWQPIAAISMPCIQDAHPEHDGATKDAVRVTSFPDLPPELQLNIIVIAAAPSCCDSEQHVVCSTDPTHCPVAGVILPQPFLVSKAWRALLQPHSAMAAWLSRWCGAQHALLRAARAGRCGVCAELLLHHGAQAATWSSAALWLAARSGWLEVRAGVAELGACLPLSR